MEWNKELIKRFRKKLNLSQEKFADLLDAPQPLISQWETGKRNPSRISQKALTLVAEKEGVDLSELEETD
ncbi:MAG: hypothetical protein DRJ47_08775 [Thermoprotei archaeon]|nr:MAG: hypothetical protein DRJ47_08775 [Thermoprotei archaeon]